MQKPTGPAPAIRCGIVLAGGNGARIKDFVSQLRGSDLPKQYVNFIGRRSMLEHTLHRAEKLIPAQKLFLVIAKQHLQFDEVRRQIASRPRQCVVIQPENRDTGPGLLLPLLYLYKQYPEAAVVVFPSDHFILEEDVFMQHIEYGFRVVESNGSRIVLLGIEPDEPDPEYGYVVPEEKVEDTGGHNCSSVELFVEKPSAAAAKKIIEKGALVNTLVLVVRCNTLLQTIKHTAPALYRSFEPIQDAIGTEDEQRVTERVYQNLPSLNFSRRVLEVLSYEGRQNLRVLRVRGVTWSDWGTSGRLSNTLRKLRKSVPLPIAQPDTPQRTLFAPQKRFAATIR